MDNDPLSELAYTRMTGAQMLIIGIMVCLNALDGFDVLAISFAAPGIAAEWGIDRARLGIVLSMELIGMALGSVLIGRMADNLGRRRTILICLTGMVAGMFMAPYSSSVTTLSIWRLLTGVGIGGMLAAISAVTAEYANAKNRHLAVSIMVIGYPLGATVGGLICAQLLKHFDWRSVFYLGGSLTAILLPLVYFLVPEPLHWLLRKRPPGALEEANRTLARLGRAPLATLPEIREEDTRRESGGIFTGPLLAVTICVTLAYSLHVTTFYFLIKWVPKMVVDMGFPASSAAGVLTAATLGGALGGATFGLLTLRYNIKALTLLVFLLGAVMVILYGRSPADLGQLTLLCGAAGFFTNAGITGMYTIFVHAYPTHVRASGTGFAVGVGRGGAVLAPIIAGFLFQGGVSIPNVALIMAFGSVLGAVALLFLKLRQPSEA